jgi:arabinogalactan endo-1,4-beta-galactosidase
MSEQDQLDWLRKHLWPNIGAMFAAVASGVRSVDPGAKFSTHISGIFIYSPDFQTAFFTAIGEAGFEVEQLGMSYYPTSSNWAFDRLERMKEAVAAVTANLQRQMFIAEYSYPAAPFSYAGDPWDHRVADYEVSSEGQAAFLRDLSEWGARTRHLSGIRPWAPDLVATGWGPMSLFDLGDRVASARPGLSAMAEGLAAAHERSSG